MMTKKGSLEYIIKWKGDCESIRCERCTFFDYHKMICRLDRMWDTLNAIEELYDWRHKYALIKYADLYGTEDLIEELL